MKKALIIVISIFISLPLALFVSIKVGNILLVDNMLSDLRGHIPELKKYVAEQNALLDGIIDIQQKLRGKNISIFDGRIRVYSTDGNGTHIHEDDLIDNSYILNDGEKELIDAFVRSYPEYGLLAIRPDEVVIEYLSSESKSCNLLLTNINRFNDGIIDNSNKYLYIEKLDETWYAILIYAPLGMP